MRPLGPSVASYALFFLVGTGSASTFRVPSEYSTIQAAVDAAAAGDSVLVAPGTYSDFEMRRITIAGWPKDYSAIVFMRAGVSVISEAGAGATTLDLQGQGTGDEIQCVLVVYQYEHGTLLQGFRITGVPSGHTAMKSYWSGPLVLRDCEFVNLDGGSWTGGVSAGLTDLALYGCRFLDCRGSINWTGGAGGLKARESSLLAEDCEFERCTGGAAVYAGQATTFGESTTFRRCTFVDNERSLTLDGGAGLRAAGGQISIEDCWFGGNTAYIGGAAFVYNADDINLEGNVFFGNEAQAGGGGLRIRAAAGLVRRNTFLANRSSWGVEGASLDVRDAHYYGLVSIENNIFSGARGCDYSVLVAPDAVTSSCNVFWDSEESDTNSGYPWAPSDTVQDPRFCDPENGDVSLDYFSPCLPENSAGCGLIGALEEGCGTVSVTPNSWAHIKAAFR